MKKAIFTAILVAVSSGAHAQEKSIPNWQECFDVSSILSRTAETVSLGKQSHLSNIGIGIGGVYRKDNKIIELRCDTNFGGNSTVGVYTDSEYQALLNRRGEEYQRQVQLRLQQDQAKLKSLGL